MTDERNSTQKGGNPFDATARVKETSGQNTHGVPGVTVHGASSNRGSFVALCQSVGDTETGPIGLVAPARLRVEEPGNSAGASNADGTLEVDRVLRIAVNVQTPAEKKRHDEKRERVEEHLRGVAAESSGDLDSRRAGELHQVKASLENTTERARLVEIREIHKARWSQEPDKAHFFKIRRWLDNQLGRILPTVNVMAEVHPAELTLADQNAVILEELTIDALGMKSGDEFILTSANLAKPAKGRPRESAILYRKAVKGYAENEVLRLRRDQLELSRSGTAPTFSPSRLPRIWVGESIRKQMHVVTVFDDDAPTRGKSCVVLISPSRYFAIMEHMREVVLGFVLAAVATLTLGFYNYSTPSDTTADSTEGGLSDASFSFGPFIWAAVFLAIALALLLARIRTKLR